MEAKLKKQLQAKGHWEGEDNGFDPGEVSQRALSGENLVLAHPWAMDKVRRLNLCMEIARHALDNGRPETRVWLVLTSNRPQPLKGFWLRSAFARDAVQIDAPWCRERMSQGRPSRLRICCPEALTPALFSSEEPPTLVIFEGLEALCQDNQGAQLEQGLLLLPAQVPLIGFLPASYPDFPFPFSGGNDLALFHRFWTREELKLRVADQPLLFLGPEGEFFAFLDRKKVANRVKRLLKESPGFCFPASDGKFSGFLQRTVAALRQEGLTPAYIVLPDAAECQRGVSLCSTVKSDVGGALTAAGIAPLLETDPSMNNDRLQEILSKRIGTLSAGGHHDWLQLMETLFSLKLIDILLLPPEGLDLVCSKGQSLVWTTTQGVNVNSQLTVQELNQARQCVSSLNQDLKGCLIGCHTNQTEGVRLKDLYLQKRASLASRLVPSPALILGLSRTTSDLRDAIIEHSWLGTQMEFSLPERMEEICQEIKEIIPEAACATVPAALALQTISFELCLELQKLETAGEVRGENRARLKERLRLKQSLLPCLECGHQSDCRGRRYKKLRDLFKEYNGLRTRFPKHIAFLDHELEKMVLVLKHTGCLGQEGRVTELGRTALRSGLDHPFVLTRCLSNGLLAGVEHHSAVPALAMLIEQSQVPVFPAVEPTPGSDLEGLAWQVLSTYRDLQCELFRFGLLLPDPSPGRGAVVEMLPERNDFGLLQQCGQQLHLSPGALLSLRNTSRRLLGRIQGRPGPTSRVSKV